MKEFQTISDFFKNIPDNIIYVVLRNFEGYEDNVFLDGHPDIDLLCKNPEKLLEYSGTTSRNNIVIISNEYVTLDIYTVGDGYYDSNWTDSMLEKRKSHNDLFYVLEEKDYFYSLLYHAIIHKHEFYVEYQIRLINMAYTLGIEISKDDSENSLYNTLNEYMRLNGYFYTYYKNPYKIANFTKIDSSLIQKRKLRILLVYLYFFIKPLPRKYIVRILKKIRLYYFLRKIYRWLKK